MKRLNNAAWSIILATIVLLSPLPAPAAEGSDDNNQASDSQDQDKEKEESKDDDKKNAKGDKSKKKDNKSKDKEDDDAKLSTTEHTTIIAGKAVKYKATAGYIVLKDFSEKRKADSDSSGDDKSGSKNKKDGKEPKKLAKMFFIAYTREDAGSVSKRPITFSFNGGPGSASVWLHMGALGPRKAALTARGEAPPPPYRLEDNTESWLDASDLVFIDPVSTGFSRTEPGEDPKKFHGYDEDIESVGEFIRLYTTKYERWTSPKFVVGESYGTTRAAGLSEYLQNRFGLYLNGIILVSAVLNWQTIDFSPGNDTPYALYVPSYTAAAWYHRKLPADLQSKPLDDVLHQAENFVAQEYLHALYEGDRLSQERKEEVANRLASFIGLPAGYVLQLNIRVPDHLFFTHLLMDKNRQLGRYDARYSGIRYNPGQDRSDYDPSFEAVHGPFTAAFNDYIRRDLHFKSDLPYETLANVWPWSFKRAENSYLNVADDLRKAMTRNPYLKVWLCCGVYDLATPYFAAKSTVDQMFLDPSIRKNVKITYYDSGHMMYVYQPAREKFKADFISFLKDALVPENSVVPSAAP